jgi:ribosomal protein S18 acetylase RimI-like enzyme
MSPEPACGRGILGRGDAAGDRFVLGLFAGNISACEDTFCETRMGLTYFKRFRMEIDLSQPLFACPRLPAGYHLRPWHESLLEAHAETKYRCFCDEIDANVFPSLGHLDGCLRMMRDISEGPNFVAPATWLLQYLDPACERIESCGTIQGIRTRESLGAIQNVGVVLAHRGRGLGSVLLYQSLVGFREAGLQRVSLEVTARNFGAQRLYRRLGFRRVRTVYKTAEVAYA